MQPHKTPIKFSLSYIYRALIAAELACLTGCSSIDCCFVINDAKHVRHFVIGVGIVRTPAPEVGSNILAVNSKALGIVVSDQPGLKLGLGYSDSSVVSIPSNVDAITEVSTCPIDNRSVRVEVNTH